MNISKETSNRVYKFLMGRDIPKHYNEKDIINIIRKEVQEYEESDSEQVSINILKRLKEKGLIKLGK